MKKIILILLSGMLFIPSLIFARTLAIGMSGSDVYQLQTFLYGQGCLSIPPTGYYGTLSARAVACYQNKNSSSITQSTINQGIQNEINAAEEQESQYYSDYNQYVTKSESDCNISTPNISIVPQATGVGALIQETQGNELAMQAEEQENNCNTDLQEAELYVGAIKHYQQYIAGLVQELNQ